MKIIGIFFSTLLLISCNVAKNENENIITPDFNFYTSYFTGNKSDLETFAKGGVCLMGGGLENDNAMR